MSDQYDGPTDAPTIKYDCPSCFGEQNVTLAEHNDPTIYFECDCGERMIPENHEYVLWLEAERRWIPVGERLPEIDDLYDVVIEDSDGHREKNMARYNRGIWGMTYSVTHWKETDPLPSPPTDTGSEESSQKHLPNACCYKFSCKCGKD